MLVTIHGLCNDGDQVFFYRSSHLKGRGAVIGRGDVEQFVWVTKEEVGEYLQGGDDYLTLLKSIL